MKIALGQFKVSNDWQENLGKVTLFMTQAQQHGARLLPALKNRRFKAPELA